MTVAERGFLPSTNPRVRSCVRCGRLPDFCICELSRGLVPPPPGEPGLRSRNFVLERRLSGVAAQAVGLTSTNGLDDFADGRAWPGGVREGMDAVQEACEEAADMRNYLVWGIERLWDRVTAGDSDAVNEYERLMRALSHMTAAWSALVVR